MTHPLVDELDLRLEMNMQHRKVKIPFKWEKLSYEASRAKVLGGWIVRNFIVNQFKNPTGAIMENAAVTIVFVPDPFHQWEV